jgi:hypothetical protein
MKNFFWIQDSSYNNVGGKNKQFETLHQVVQFVENKGYIQQGLGDIYEVHQAVSGGGVTIQEVADAFARGESPANLDDL